MKQSLLSCSGGLVSVFRWFRWVHFGGSGGFVSVFRLLVHAIFHRSSESSGLMVNASLYETARLWRFPLRARDMLTFQLRDRHLKVFTRGVQTLKIQA